MTTPSGLPSVMRLRVSPGRKKNVHSAWPRERDAAGAGAGDSVAGGAAGTGTSAGRSATGFGTSRRPETRVTTVIATSSPRRPPPRILRRNAAVEVMAERGTQEQG